MGKIVAKNEYKPYNKKSLVEEEDVDEEKNNIPIDESSDESENELGASPGSDLEEIEEESEEEDEGEEMENGEVEGQNEYDYSTDSGAEEKNIQKTNDPRVSQEEHMDSLRNTINEELKEMSFEEIKKLQNKIGLKKFNEMMNPGKSEAPIRTLGRANKNRPQELSSKKPTSMFRKIVPVKKQEFIDPRFSSAFGEYKPELFRKSYSFVHDMRLSEKEELGKQLKEEDDPEKKEQIKSALTRLKQQIKSFEESEKKQTFNENIKKKKLWLMLKKANGHNLLINLSRLS